MKDFSDVKTLAQEIESYLGKLIIEGQIQPGVRLIPEELAKEFNVSKSPVREAIAMLEKEELVVRKSRMGFYVADILLKDIEEIYPIRASLNSLMVKSILEEGYDGNFIPTLKDIIAKKKKLAAKGDTSTFFEQNVLFYEFLKESCPNKHLCRIINLLGRKVLRFRYLVHSQPGHSQRTIVFHEKFVTALEKHDIEASRSIAEQIILNGLNVLRELFKKQTQGQLK